MNPYEPYISAEFNGELADKHWKADKYYRISKDLAEGRENDHYEYY